MRFETDLAAYSTHVIERMRLAREANIPTRARITSLLLPNSAHKSDDNLYAIAEQSDAICFTTQGLLGERHVGTSRDTNGRDRALYKKELHVANTRHLVCISSGDIETLSDRVGHELTPELLGVNIVLDREDHEAFYVSQCPGGMYIAFDGETLSKNPLAVVKMYAKQEGCGTMGVNMETQTGIEGLARAFVQNSKENRGIVCEIEYIRDKPFTTLTTESYAHFLFPKHTTP